MSLSHHRTKAALREPLLARFLAQLGKSQAVAADLAPWRMIHFLLGLYMGLSENIGLIFPMK